MYIWNLLKEKKGGGGEERKERWIRKKNMCGDTKGVKFIFLVDWVISMNEWNKQVILIEYT